MDIGYRLTQAWYGLTAVFRPIDYERVREVLGSEELLALFKRMRRAEQLHSIRVMETLQAQGHTHPALLQAALLHDVGKSRYWFGFFGRVAVVVAKKLASATYEQWAQADPGTWKRPFVIAAKHPQWSAADMAAAGAPPMAVELARRHQNDFRGPVETQVDRLLLHLKAADDAN